MPRREDDDVARGPAGPAFRTLLQAFGFVLAVSATLAVLFTDDPQLLKVAVVLVAWAFVLASVAAGHRGTDRVRAAAREADLRRAYELELEREVAARREYQLELETELRRETEDALRDELDALRGDIAALGDLRQEVARVSSLRGDLAALSGLRDDVAALTGLRSELGRLVALREDRGELAALREDMDRLRAELTEQLSGEMLVERIVMRTQASRVLDEARETTTQHFEQVRATSWSAPPPPAARRPPVPPCPTAPSPTTLGRHDRAAAHQLDPVPGPGPSRQSSDRLPPVAPATVAPPVVMPSTGAPRRRHTDEPDRPPVPGDLALTTQHPAVAPPWVAAGRADDLRPAAGTNDRLAEILAENAVRPAPGGRRRRRYREDGEPDDVLARVLGR